MPRSRDDVSCPWYTPCNAGALPRMLAYRREEVRRSTREYWGWLTEARSGDRDVDARRDLLVSWGELETALVDACSESRDISNDRTRFYRDVAQAIARRFVLSTRGVADDTSLEPWLTRLSALGMPAEVWVRAAEGYTHYGVYPEQYVAAAEQLHHELGAMPTVVLGLRSIGTSLSAVVAATLRERGVEVESLTVRPRGHPFERELRLDPSLCAELSRCVQHRFVVVDEGPGLSGSSFWSACRALLAFGVPAERIVLVPSWDPDPSRLCHSGARELWPQLRRYVGSFDPRRLLPRDALTVLSAGAWRARFAWPAGEPAVVPQHERRKYLEPRPGRNARLWRFAGFGRHGRRALHRAERLAERGLSARPEGLRAGLLGLEYLPGTPLWKGAMDAGLLNRIAGYVAYVRELFPATSTVDVAALLELIEVNTREALGEAALSRLTGLEHWSQRLPREASFVDGRHLPHEWLLTSGEYVKADAWDHGGDHFFPGPTDVAWDLAGVAVEWQLGPAALSHLLDRYVAASRDGSVRERFDFYAVAYAAFRAGYASIAAATLGESPEKGRFGELGARYRGALAQAIERFDHG